MKNLDQSDSINSCVRLKHLPFPKRERLEMIHRGKLLTTAATGTGFVLGQLFDMRSDVEHVHDLSRSIHYVPLAHREAIALHRTRQAEALVCFAYRAVFANSTLRTNFVSDTAITAFWAQTDTAIRSGWGKSFDLLAVQ